MWVNLVFYKGKKYIFILQFRFLDDDFDLLKLATITVENFFQCVQLSDGSVIKLRLLDTAGQERFNCINESYYKQADCCLLVYDITNKDSFEGVKNYYVPKIKEYCNQILKVVLLGNKADLKDQRQVEDIEGRDLALEKKYIFMESSCKDNYNVADAFTALVEMTNIELKKVNKTQTIKIKKDNKKNKKKNKCC